MLPFAWLAAPSLLAPFRPLATRRDCARCTRPRLTLGGDDRAELEELLRALEGLRDWVSNDVAFAAMQAALDAGRQVLLLVPEIGLTPQTLNRIRGRFDVPLAVLHSALAEGARSPSSRHTRLTTRSRRLK